MTEKEKKIQDIINGIETSEEIKIRQEILESIEFTEKYGLNTYKEKKGKPQNSPNKTKDVVLFL